jgi:glutathione S-transferase
MNKPRLTYFDAPVSRGEECRLALHVAGVAFDDNRVKLADWPALKPTTPFGSLPVLELPGQPPLAQSNAILTLLGRLHGLHPTDLYEAARHEAIMQHCEDLRTQLGPTLRMAEAQKKAVREELAANYLPLWGRNAEKHIPEAGPFFQGAKLHVVDIKLFAVLRWFKSGALDHIASSIFDGYPKLSRVHDAVRDDARIKAWYAC